MPKDPFVSLPAPTAGAFGHADNALQPATPSRDIIYRPFSPAMSYGSSSCRVVSIKSPDGGNETGN